MRYCLNFFLPYFPPHANFNGFATHNLYAVYHYEMEIARKRKREHKNKIRRKSVKQSADMQQGQYRMTTLFLRIQLSLVWARVWMAASGEPKRLTYSLCSSARSL